MFKCEGKSCLQQEHSHHRGCLPHVSNRLLHLRVCSFSSSTSFFFLTIIFKKYQWTLTSFELEEFSDLFRSTVADTEKRKSPGKATQLPGAELGFPTCRSASMQTGKLDEGFTLTPETQLTSPLTDSPQIGNLPCINSKHI